MALKLKEYRSSFDRGPALADYLSYDTHDDGVFILKDGSLGMMWSLAIISQEGLSEEERDRVRVAIEGVVMRIPAELACQIILVSSSRIEPVLQNFLSIGNLSDPMTELFLDSRMEVIREAAKLAPFTPSNTARSGGTIFPVIKNIPPLYGSEPGPTARRIGSYIMWTAFATTCLTSAMFLTGLAPNLLALSLVKTTAKIDISWTEWFMGIMPVGVLLFAFLPLIVYKIYPPELKSSPDVPVWAGEELKKMGRISVREISMALLVLLALGLWIFGGDFINATTVALLVLSLMVMTRIVEWDDVLAHKQAWNVLVWFATLVTMADGLNKVGFLKWFAGGASGALSGYSVMTIVVALTVVYFVVHYMFASLTAHTTALLPVLLTAAIAVPEMPVKLISLLFCYTLGLMGIISPYATGPGPIYYGSGYVGRKEFWTLGLIFGAIYLAVLLFIGVPYLRFYLG